MMVFSLVNGRVFRHVIRFWGVAAFCLLAASCGPGKQLYYWGGEQNRSTAYENYSYAIYHSQTPKSICDLLVVYEDMIAHPGGLRNVPPPGVCAEYAYLLSNPETAQAFAANATKKQKALFATDNYETYFMERAKELFEMEMTLYPESAIFLTPILKRL